MKKIFKGLFTAFLAVGFLAGCAKTMYTVEFYEDNLGKFHSEVQVEKGKTVARPATDPTRANYTFDDWWVDEDYSEKFEFTTPIIKDTEIFGKWIYTPPYVEDTRDFHIAGDLQNTDLDYIGWMVDDTFDERSVLTKAEDSNLYSIELEIGYLGKFKVKVPNRPWDADTEFDYTDIRSEDLQDYLQEGDTRNIQVNDAGRYRIEVETTFLWARVTRLGDATGDGVKPTPEPGSISAWGIVGSHTGWGSAADTDIMLTYDATSEHYHLEFVYFQKDVQWKLRADESWGEEFGSHADNLYAVGTMANELETVEEVEQIKVGGNITVLESGLYTVMFDGDKIVVERTTFGLRGSAFGAEGWNADTELEYVSTTFNSDVEEAVVSVTMVWEAELTVVDGEYKAKHAAVGLTHDGEYVEIFSGWDYGFGADGSGDNTVITAGSYDFVITMTYDLETGDIVGSVVTTAAVA